jgi:hypothetical protein
VQAPDGETLTRLLVDVPADRRAAISRRVAELVDLLGETRFTVRFPSRASAALLGQSPPRA